MRQVGFCFRLLFVGFLLLHANKIAARPIQVIEGDSIQPIGSQTSQTDPTWWATVEEIDPESVSLALLSTEETALSERIEDSADQSNNNPGAPWIAVAVPGMLTELYDHGYTDEKNEVWYLKELIIKNPRPGLALRLGQINDKDIVYFNGKKIGSSGEWGNPKPMVYDTTRVYEIPESALKPGLNVILVHVQGYFIHEIGITNERVEIGRHVDISKQLVSSDYQEVLLLACYFTAGSYFLFLFLRRMQERENLFFALFVYAMVIYQVFKTQFKLQLGLDLTVIKKIEYTLLYCLFPLFYLFLRYYYRTPSTLLWRIWGWVINILIVVQAGLILHVLISDDVREYWTYQKNIAQPLWLLFIAGMFAILISGLRKRNRDAIYMLGGFLFVFVGASLDIISSRGWIIMPRIMSYVFFAFMLSLALVLANRFVRVNEEVEDLNENLELKVSERTKQLNTSLSEIQALKERQDGDYFLTSLLIAPLGGNHNRNLRVNTQITQRQMKQFQFRKWRAEIGGDHCAVHSLQLKNGDYTVFINADAMGKSIQGAGGALVLGTVFQAMIVRSQLATADETRYPEQWLKDCLIELQSVFISFSGSMLLSAIIGLVENNTGLVYFINAEHPYPVLLRNGKASFVETPIFRKFGIISEDEEIKVELLQLERDDVLIVASDGRDDVSLGTDSTGQRIINEDHKIFLGHVERGQGSIEEITSLVFSYGGQIDDYSMIRIGYLEDGPSAANETLDSESHDSVKEAIFSYETNDLENCRRSIYRIRSLDGIDSKRLLQLSKVCKALKEYAKGAEVLETYLRKRPNDNDALVDLSIMLKLSGKRKEAIELGERCLLRDPSFIKNLVNLADTHRLMGNLEKARYYVAKAINLGGSRSDLAKLRDLVGA